MIPRLIHAYDIHICVHSSSGIDKGDERQLRNPDLEGFQVSPSVLPRYLGVASSLITALSTAVRVLIHRR